MDVFISNGVTIAFSDHAPHNLDRRAPILLIHGFASTQAINWRYTHWIKALTEDGRRVIDRATFQSFGCQTAIAVASVATELIRGKTAEEALSLSGEELSAPLGALPPMKIHCAQLVEQALQSALTPTTSLSHDNKPSCSSPASTLSDQLHPQTGKFKINILPS